MGGRCLDEANRTNKEEKKFWKGVSRWRSKFSFQIIKVQIISVSTCNITYPEKPISQIKQNKKGAWLLCNFIWLCYLRHNCGGLEFHSLFAGRCTLWTMNIAALVASSIQDSGLRSYEFNDELLNWCVWAGVGSTEVAWPDVTGILNGKKRQNIRFIEDWKLLLSQSVWNVLY